MVPNMFHTMNTAQMAQPVTSFRITTPSAPAKTDRSPLLIMYGRPNSVILGQNTVFLALRKHLLPYIIRSDNSPCYNSKEFQQFLQCFSITHQTSSPNHPRSNGFVERMVGVAKKLIDKAGKEGKLDFRSI